MKNLILLFIIMPVLAFAQRTQKWDADNYNPGGMGNITKQELYNLQGTSSNVQTQLNGKQATITGGATTITTSNLSTNKALQSDGSGKVSASSTVDTTELGYLDGVTSSIQTQINTNSTNIGTNSTNITGLTSRVGTLEGYDKVVEFTNFAGFPGTGATATLYLDKALNKLYRWSGSSYSLVGDGTGTGDVVGPSTATDECLARYDGTTGKLLQDSKVCVDDNGLLIALGSTGAGIYNQGKDYVAIWGDGATTTGSNATLDITSFGGVVGVANSSLVSISNITPIPGTPVRRFTLINNTGNSITIVNDPTTGVASTGIYTGTGQDITLGNKAALTFVYNSTRWIVVGGTGGGSGTPDLDIAFYQDFETAKLTDFTQTGLTIDTAAPLHAKKSAKLTHDASVVQSFKQVIAIDKKFRNRSITLKIDCISTASTGNVTVSVRDETNSTTLLSSTQLACSSVVDSYYVSYTTASTTASVSYTVSGLVQSGSPVTYVDDIVSYTTKLPALSASLTVPKAVINDYSVKVAASGTVVAGSETIDWINGDCTNADPRVCTFKSGIFTVAPNCVASDVTDADKSTVRVIATSATSVSVRTVTDGVGGSTNAFNLFCEKSGADYIDPTTSTETKTIALTKSALTQDADSYFKVDGILGLASTNTTVARLNSANIRSNIGSDVTYTPSATLGDSWTINTDGTYTINYSFYGQVSTNVTAAITKNGSQLSTNPQSFTNESEVLDYGEGDTDSTTRATVKLSWTGPLKATDVVRIQQGNASTANGALTNFSIAKQGALKQTVINTNSKIKIPTSEVLFEGATTRGSTNTSIVNFSAIAKLVGDAFTINPDGISATFGTHVKMAKSGWLCVGGNIYLGASGGYSYLTRNQASNLSGGGEPTSASEILKSAGASNSSAPYLSTEWCGLVSNGDYIRLATSSNPTNDPVNHLRLTFFETDIQVSVSNTMPTYTDTDSMYRAVGNGGYGSTATKIKRFSSVLDNSGSDISCVDSATLGLACTVNSDGVYSISYTEQFAAAGYFGLTKNASSLTTNIYSVTNSEVLATSMITVSTANGNVNWQGKLVKGDVVRPHTDGNASGTGQPINFTMAKIGKPNSTTDVTAFANIPVAQYEAIESNAGTTTFGSTNTAVPVFTISKNTNNGIVAVDSSSTAGTSFRVLKKSKIFISGTAQAGSGSATIFVTRNETVLTATTPSSAIAGETIPGSIGALGSVDAEILADVGDVIRVQRDSTNITSFYRFALAAIATPDTIVTPVESFSTDAANLSFKASDVASTDAVGTFSTYSWTANSNTKAACATAPTQSLASVSADGFFITGRAYNATGSCNTPSVFKIQVGKGFKGRSVNGYISAGKTTPFDWIRDLSDGTVGYGTNVFYDEKTGILTIDAGLAFASSMTTRNVGYDINGNVNVLAGYFVVNMSKTPTLSGISYVSPRVAFLSDVKASGTAGGALTGSTWNSRNLNTLDDASSIITNPSSFTGVGGTNTQFTLPAGEYIIEGAAPAYSIGNHKIRLRNITDSTTTVVGRSASSSPSVTIEESGLVGRFVITSAKVFEIQHWAATTGLGNGAGIQVTSGENEIYTQLKITKVK